MNAQFLPLLLLAVLAVLLILNTRRQKRAIADAQRLQKSLVNGDRVVTTSGLHATVVGSAEDTTIDLEIAPGVRTRWLRAAIGQNITTADVASAPLAAPVDGNGRPDNS
ncbi:MAG: preprotein translocase subunit YajC [Pseudonocardiaceae bacterium]